MYQNKRQNIIILLFSILFMSILLAQASGISNSLMTQSDATLTPYAYLPVISKPALFVKTDPSPFYLQNFANNAGCDWLGVAGEVLDIDKNPVPAESYRVHVWGSGIDMRVTVGTASAYSPSGWELFLFDSPVVRDYEIQLEASNGTAVSPIYAFQTKASCNENLVRFDFIQNY
ncbi:MAG: hypothetical protein H6669_08780 [Ardenticatenaceae bacterium]|nr:hypothetical protein [Ardenticatenaceae bacterium]